ncbi:MAG: NF038130 family PEP-CTERM protein [Microcoleaceae cyanobacterium]
MTKLVKKLLIGASMVVGVGTMGAVPTNAASLTGITFNTTDIEVFGRNGSVGSGVNEAMNALTDSDVVTNVELGASSEDPNANVGFSGFFGNTAVSVETVTAADWAIFGDQWVQDFSAAYSDLFSAEIFGINVGQAISAAVQGGLTRSGDPNIGSFVQDDATGEYQLGLIGHLDLLQSDSLDQALRAEAAEYASNNPFFSLLSSDQQNTMLDNGVNSAKNQISSYLGGNPLQMSEVAKVTIDGVVNYAYSFSATDTGYVDTDGSSHSGLYSWTLAGEPQSIQAVPEPSSMLGLMAVGGLVTLSQRKSRKKV